MKELKKFFDPKTGLYEFGSSYYTEGDISKLTECQKHALVSGGWVVLEGEKCACWECKYQKEGICTKKGGGYGEGATCEAMTSL
jgi:hypothetical protein